ncbi:hypothetical protein B0H15DRAFT_38290 [Mycena belliarum]|uniref:Uncharacterized protein n=1 Tax=Mycena belliarum TaxID=1033014 RepID=A0AAD6TRS4_9AGAR|nr:hypothetical protein B0H15DRAFT_38290 [Mycena belliae]
MHAGQPSRKLFVRTHLIDIPTESRDSGHSDSNRPSRRAIEMPVPVRAPRAIATDTRHQVSSLCAGYYDSFCAAPYSPEKNDFLATLHGPGPSRTDGACRTAIKKRIVRRCDHLAAGPFFLELSFNHNPTTGHEFSHPPLSASRSLSPFHLLFQALYISLAALCRTSIWRRPLAWKKETLATTRPGSDSNGQCLRAKKCWSYCLQPRKTKILPTVPFHGPGPS